MLGMGPILWRRAFREAYPMQPHTDGNPYERKLLEALRASLPPRKDGKPRMPASTLYYDLIDSATAVNIFAQAFTYRYTPGAIGSIY